MAKTKKTKAVTLGEKPVNGTSLVKAIDNIAEYSDFNDKGIIGKCDGVFPLTTATANNIYFLPSNGKYYKCKTNYNGNQLTIPNDNFIDMSVLQNSDRLDNLFSYILYKTVNYISPKEKILLCNLIELVKNKVGIYEIIISCGSKGLDTILKKYIFLNPGYGNRNILEVYSFAPGPYPKNIEIDTKTTDVFISNSFEVICKIFIRYES